MISEFDACRHLTRSLNGNVLCISDYSKMVFRIVGYAQKGTSESFAERAGVVNVFALSEDKIRDSYSVPFVVKPDVLIQYSYFLENRVSAMFLKLLYFLDSPGIVARCCRNTIASQGRVSCPAKLCFFK